MISASTPVGDSAVSPPAKLTPYSSAKRRKPRINPSTHFCGKFRGMANANIDEKQIRSVLELLSFPGNLTPRQLHLSSACMGAKPVRTLQTCGPRPIRQASPRYQIARVTEK